MTSEELQQARAAKRAAANGDGDIVAWVRAAAFPTLAQLLEARPRAEAVVEEALAGLRLLELELWPHARHYAPADLAAYFYALVGDRQPLRDYKRQAERRKLSWLAAEVYELLLGATGPMSAAMLRDGLGAEGTSVLGVSRALAELARTLKILRLGRDHAGGELWSPLIRLWPEVPASAARLGQPEAAGALVCYWLDAMICDTESAIAAALSPVLSASRVHQAVAALTTVHQLEISALDGRPALQWPTPPAAARPVAP